MKKLLLTCWLVILFCGISYLFWYNEWKYSLPTPVPAHYHAVTKGTMINLQDLSVSKFGKPVLLHFFNPDCPCSRFNISHFKSLVKKYGHQVSFAIVVMMSYNKYTEKNIQDKFDINIPVFFDQSIAISCGVYSTPQAALIDTDHKLYFRGNYNKSRYCSDPKTNYAQMAIDSLLAGHRDPFFGREATVSYGCSLPNCKK